MTLKPETCEYIRRSLDIVVALLSLIVMAPLMLLIALAVLVECGRPVFFAQTRLGQGGRHFSIYKFRKFKTTQRQAGLPLTMHNDPRMSRVGRVLATTKLDELPQFYNILRGDMSLVGPRPESLEFAECFDNVQQAILEHRPGIFGPSQVAFRNEGTLYPYGLEPTKFYREVLFPAKAAVDLDYYCGRTLRSDIKWILVGVLAVAGLTSGVDRDAGLGAPRSRWSQP